MTPTAILAHMKAGALLERTCPDGDTLTPAFRLGVIAQLADTQAGTAEMAALLSRTSKRERERQASICGLYLDVLEGRGLKKRPRTPDDVAKRLRGAIRILEGQAQQ